MFVDFDEMGFCPTTLCENAEEYATQWRNNMRNAIENHETDLLKEFVEWAINCVSVGNDISECKTLATSLTTDADTREFCAKRYAAFSQYSSGLRFGLEQFLKMKGIEVDK